MELKPLEITVQDRDRNGGATFFFDLAIIMPLKKATLHLKGEKNCRILVGNEYICSQEDKDSYDITELCAENDGFAFSFRSAPERFSCEIYLEYAGGVEQKVVTGQEWTYGSFYLTDKELSDKAKYLFELVPEMNKPVKVIGKQ